MKTSRFVYGLVCSLCVCAALAYLPTAVDASCNKKVDWQGPDERGDGGTWQCTDPVSGNTFTCYNRYWYIPGHNECSTDSSPEVCQCCQICKMEATYHYGSCNAAGCQAGNPANPPPGAHQYYFAATLLSCTPGTPSGNPPTCNDSVPHANCKLFEPGDCPP